MKILAIETSGRMASVALVELTGRGGRSGIRPSSPGEGLRATSPARLRRAAERIFPSRMTLNQTLTAHVRELCEGVPLAQMGLDGIAVGIGPGSFTGVRMGVAVAKALAHALEVPLVGVSAPQAMAVAAPAMPGAGVCVLQRARADEVYVTALRIEGANLATEVAPTQVVKVKEGVRVAAELLGGPPDVLCGDGVRERAGVVQSLADTQIAEARYDVPRAAVMAEIAAGLVEGADKQAAFDLRPRYVRLSQAEREHGIDLSLR